MLSGDERPFISSWICAWARRGIWRGFPVKSLPSKIAVTGHEVIEEGGRGPKLVVSSVHLVTASGLEVPAGCPIRVCTKKNCWRSGGKELWHALEAELAERGLTVVHIVEKKQSLEDVFMTTVEGAEPGVDRKQRRRGTARPVGGGE